MRALPLAALLLLLGVANLAVAVVIAQHDADLAVPRFHLSVLLRLVLPHGSSTGWRTSQRPGPHTIIALNHVSFLDAGVALSFLEQEPVFAIDHGIAKRWWVKPFLKLTRAMPLDPTKPMATRSLINAVKAGETLIIFPKAASR